MTDLLDQALEKFELLLEEARSFEATDASLGALATASAIGRPSVRTVQFTGISDRQFSYFANRNSGKGRQLAENPWASLCFYWPRLEQQIVIEGGVVELTSDESDRLWHPRPRSAALMAWASDQSKEGTALDERVTEVRARFSDERVPRPPDWIAYGIAAHRIEFWGGGWRRKQVREAYLKSTEGWRRAYLDP